jgi:hypothetical protein
LFSGVLLLPYSTQLKGDILMGKKILALSVLAMFVVVGCGKGDKIADMKKVMNDMTAIFTAYGTSVENAKSGKDVAAAMVKFAEGIKAVSVKAKELEKKYPDIKLKDSKTMPKELEADAKKLEEAGKVMMSKKVMDQMAKYMADPDVLKAQKDMMEKMKDM